MELGFLGWILYGLVIGALAKLLMPGNQAMGWLTTIILGIVGALLGGFIANNLLGFGEDGNAWDFKTILVSVLGAILALFLYGALTKKR